MIDYLLGYVAVFGCAIGGAFFVTIDRQTVVKFVWYDLWVGAYWDRQKRLLYVLPVPCIVFVFDFRRVDSSVLSKEK